jgi:hypothetical protein
MYFVVLFNPIRKRFAGIQFTPKKVSGFIYNDNTKSPLINVNMSSIKLEEQENRFKRLF